MFGDVVDSRRDPGSTAWLRALRADLEAAVSARDAASRRSGSPRATRSRGCSRPTPTRSSRSSAAALRPDARTLRWAVVAGEVEPGTGPATERTGPAFLAAREALGARQGAAATAWSR